VAAMASSARARTSGCRHSTKHKSSRRSLSLLRFRVKVPRLVQSSHRLSGGGAYSNAVQARDVPDFMGPAAASSPGPPIHAAHVFLQTEHERGPPLHRRCARIYVIAAGPPPPLMLQGASILSGEPYPFMRLRDEAGDCRVQGIAGLGSHGRRRSAAVGIPSCCL